jgi:hypothetical protein
MTALRALLAGSIDYAGLFPPAELGMSEAVRNYRAYRASDAAWALGRFVVPASRLGEFEQASVSLLPARPSDEAWRLSALLGADPSGDLGAIGEFNCRHAAGGAGAAVTDVVEAKADSTAAVAALLSRMPGYVQGYVEVPVDPDPAALIAAIASQGGRAKVRTGGVTAEAFPATGHLVRFFDACVRAGVAFKATAGLHHPLRAEYPLTYAPDGPRGRMFGFLNVFLATAFMAEGLEPAVAADLLEESSASALHVTSETIEWRGRRLDLAPIEAARRRAIVSFGSCSFTEPIGDLTALGLL